MFPSERIEATPINVTPVVEGAEGNKTSKYEPQNQVLMEHVYTDIFDSEYCGTTNEHRYCLSTDDNTEMYDTIGEELGREAEHESPYGSSRTELKSDRDRELELECTKGRMNEESGVDSNKDNSEIDFTSQKVETPSAKCSSQGSIDYYDADNT